MDRGRAGGFITDNNYIALQFLRKKREDHLARMQKIKNRKPGTSKTLDQNPPQVLNASANVSRKSAVHHSHNFIIERENRALIKRISTILTAPPKIRVEDYYEMKKLFVGASGALPAFEKVLQEKKIKHFFENIKNVKPVYKAQRWEADYQHQKYNQKFMRQVHYNRRPSDTGHGEGTEEVEEEGGEGDELLLAGEGSMVMEEVLEEEGDGAAGGQTGGGGTAYTPTQLLPPPPSSQSDHTKDKQRFSASHIDQIRQRRQQTGKPVLGSQVVSTKQRSPGPISTGSGSRKKLAAVKPRRLLVLGGGGGSGSGHHRKAPPPSQLQQPIKRPAAAVVELTVHEGDEGYGDDLLLGFYTAEEEGSRSRSRSPSSSRPLGASGGLLEVQVFAGDEQYDHDDFYLEGEGEGDTGDGDGLGGPGPEPTLSTVLLGNATAGEGDGQEGGQKEETSAPSAAANTTTINTSRASSASSRSTVSKSLSLPLLAAASSATGGPHHSGGGHGKHSSSRRGTGKSSHRHSAASTSSSSTSRGSGGGSGTTGSKAHPHLHRGSQQQSSSQPIPALGSGGASSRPASSSALLAPLHQAGGSPQSSFSMMAAAPGTGTSNEETKVSLAVVERTVRVTREVIDLGDNAAAGLSLHEGDGSPPGHHHPSSSSSAASASSHLERNGSVLVTTAEGSCLALGNLVEKVNFLEGSVACFLLNRDRLVLVVKSTRRLPNVGQDFPLEVEAELSASDLAVLGGPGMNIAGLLGGGGGSGIGGGEGENTSSAPLDLTLLTDLAMEICENVEVKVDLAEGPRIVLNLIHEVSEDDPRSRDALASDWQAAALLAMNNPGPSEAELDEILLPDRDHGLVYRGGVRIPVHFAMGGMASSVANIGRLIEIAKQAAKVEQVLAMVTVRLVADDQVEVTALFLHNTMKMFRRGSSAAPMRKTPSSLGSNSSANIAPSAAALAAAMTKPALRGQSQLSLTTSLPSVVQVDPELVGEFAENLAHSLKVEHDPRNGLNLLVMNT